MPLKLQFRNKSCGRLEAKKSIMIKQMLKTVRGLALTNAPAIQRKLNFLCCSNGRVAGSEKVAQCGHGKMSLRIPCEMQYPTQCLLQTSFLQLPLSAGWSQQRSCEDKWEGERVWKTSLVFHSSLKDTELFLTLLHSPAPPLSLKAFTVKHLVSFLFQILLRRI